MTCFFASSLLFLDRMKNLIWFCVFIYLLLSCQSPPETSHFSGTSFNPSQQYFLTIAFGAEYGQNATLKKWQKDIKIYVTDSTQTLLLQELDRIIAELNNLIGEIQLYRVNSRSKANFIIYFGDAATYMREFAPEAAQWVPDNFGFFWVNWDAKEVITNGTMYVDLQRTQDNNCRRHLLREELTQALGLMQDSKQYPNSIFQQNWTCSTTYADIDRDLIQLLYNPKLRPGMSKKEVINFFNN